MEYTEASVSWPDLTNPVTTTRDLSLPNGKQGVRRIEQINLSILVNACLYVVQKDTQGLRMGDILSRNIDLTRRKGQDPNDFASQVFVRFGSLFDARRGIGRIYSRYQSIELPELSRWGMDADWLLRAAWTLHLETQEGVERFVWLADRRIQKHILDRSSFKEKAVQKFAKVATLKDRLGRRNTPSLPLQLMSAGLALTGRAQEIRGIGRRMDWRAVALEHYFDQLKYECLAIRRAAQDALTARDLFGDTRTPKSLRTRAGRMANYAEFLKETKVRTFNRVFAHVVGELEEISELLHQAADARSTGPLEHVQVLLGRIYHAMILAEQHWRLQEILLVVSELFHRNQQLTDDQVMIFIEELTDIHRILTTPDSITQNPVGSGFSADVVPRVHEEIALAKLDLLNVPGPNIKGVYEHLKRACDPI